MKRTKPWDSAKKNSTKIGQQTKECLDFLIKANLRVFQNNKKQAKINIVLSPKC